MVTADHGIVDVPKENQVLLDEMEIPNLLAVTGDPRNTFLYFEHETDVQATKTLLEEQLENKAVVATVQDLQDAGWLSPEIENSRFLPDLYLIALSNFASYHRSYCKPQSLRMVGQHGSISQTELSVPLIRFGSLQV